MNSVFDPEATDVVTPLAYCKLGKDVEMHIGMDYILLSFTPCPILKVLGHLGLTTDQSSFAKHNEVHNVTILDARKQNLGGFHETGFTLIELEEEPETQDWRKLIINPRTKEKDESADIKKFFDQMEPHILELYPQTKRIRWTYNVVRGRHPDVREEYKTFWTKIAICFEGVTNWGISLAQWEVLIWIITRYI